MKTANTNSSHTNTQRNASQPFPVPLQEYALTPETLAAVTGRKVARNRMGYHYTIRFVSFSNGQLSLAITNEGETHTLTLYIQPQQLTIACSCQSSVATLCTHAYEYLFNIARIGGDYAFTPFAPGGVIETALAHKSHFTIQYTGRHGITVLLKSSNARIYHLESNWATLGHLHPYNQLSGREEGFIIQSPRSEALCYLLMSSPRNTLAPFILPCIGVLNKGSTAIKSFKNYITGAEEGLGSFLSSDELPRIKACTEIMKKCEAAPGLAHLGEEQEKSDALATLFRLFTVSLPLFRGAILYVHPYYSKKRLGNRPVKTYVWQATIAAETPTLSFHLRHKGGSSALTLSILVGGKAVANPHIVASFFVSSVKGATLYRFASLRDVGIAFWMEQNRGLITVFSNHFPAFHRNILQPLQQHYQIKETGKKKPEK